ncbi:hypothetical protein tb265_29720 [Gemmatimonadetes bacterium T265]|nr:hypothetical protein tb265_29720 [Gemmatimonadetes bacterium T265]
MRDATSRAPDGSGRNLVRAALANRQVVYVLTALVVLLGLTSLARMPRREDPKITIRQGLVLALYPGATAEQVERQVAEPVERRLFAHAEVKKAKTYTTSRPGALVANVELNDDVRDPERFWSTLRHDLNETRAGELPAGVVGPVVNADFGDVVAVLLTVHGPPGRYGSRELATYLDRIEDAVRTLPDVSKIKRYGEQPEEIAVTARPERLAQYGVTTAQLLGALRARNAVADGGAVDAGASEVRIRPAGPFDTEREVGALQVGTSPSGTPVTLRDVAAVERRYADPTFLARVDNAPVVLMSIEAQEGRNLVSVGRQIDAKLAAVRAELPPDLRIDLVADQPASVQHRVLGFGREFTIAVVAVVLVTVLLLPLRVAAIAATAIPITVAVTVAALNALGIELHQMSFAGLVVALGMVVDDAIVIADNYVELLDHGVPRDEAAWRSASDLAVPVLGATLTIVASFLPLAFLLPGTVGEFIRALPLTVSVALLCSYAVAMLLTPLLCLAFITTGLRPHVADEKPRRFDPLGAMQRLYERTMALAMPRKGLTLALSAAAFAAGVAMLRVIPMRFFPAAERAQFVVDVWTPEGTRFEETDSVVQRLVADVRRVDGVRAVGSFTGSGSPRFYYNINPEPPATNYGQLVVNTRETEGTPALAASLHARLAALAPEATVMVKELQQGAALPAPIEVRYSGADLAVLRRLADSARAVLEATPGSEYVTTNWRDDRYGVRVDLRRETAARLGITDADVAQQLAGGFDGAVASTYYEGDRRIDVRLRLDSASRRGVGDVRDAYVTSPATGARLPLREAADVRPEWQPSRIVRRNGVRTVTVQSFARPGVLASTVLNAALPRLDAVPVPDGYAMTLGGEVENQGEVQGPMSVALSASLLGIFLILFLQFRNARYPLIVMASIPLAVFGSALGLVLTRNPFGFTAQLGLTALTGVVVRNAIILVDFILLRRAEGESLEDAALDAGRRRLRPIFLTTVAAAVGVVPLIVSGSSLWSPLASVLAVGLVCSMVFTLVVVPVLYVLVESRRERRAARRAGRGVPEALATTPAADPALVPLGRAASTLAPGLAAGALLLVALAAAPPRQLGAQDVTPAAAAARRLTLDEALRLAAANGRAARVAAAQVAEQAARVRGARAELLPTLSATGNYSGRSGVQSVLIPQGALGNDVNGRPLPGADRDLSQASRSTFYSIVTATQPLTQGVRIRAGRDAAQAAYRRSTAARDATARDVALGVTRLYLGALAAERQRDAARLVLAARRRRAGDVARTVAAGLALDARAAEARAAVLDAEQQLVAAGNEAADDAADLAELIGWPADVPMTLDAPAPLDRLTAPADASPAGAPPAGGTRQGRDALGTPALADRAPDALTAGDSARLAALVGAALAANPEVRAARATRDEAAGGTRAARAAYVPDVALYAQYYHQTLTTVLPQNNLTGGLSFSWTIADFGRRRSAVDAAAARQLAASEDAARVEERTTTAVFKAYRAAVRAERLWDAARAAAAARRDVARVAADEGTAGLRLASSREEQQAAAASADAAAFAAEVGVRLARADLARAVGADVRPLTPGATSPPR